VLAHLQGGDADAAGVDGLGGGHNHALLLHQIGQGIVGGGHIGHLNVILDAVGGDLLGLVQIHVVLGGGRHDNVGLDAPGLLAGVERYTELVGIILDLVPAAVAHLHQIGDFLGGVDTVGVVDIAVGTGQGDH